MDPNWLDKYPRAAALLQGKDDVLLYEPHEGDAPLAPGMFGPVSLQEALLQEDILCLRLQASLRRLVAAVTARHDTYDRGDW